MDEPVMGAWTTAGFVPPSVYIGFPLFVLPGTCPGEYRDNFEARNLAIS